MLVAVFRRRRRAHWLGHLGVGRGVGGREEALAHGDRGGDATLLQLVQGIIVRVAVEVAAVPILFPGQLPRLDDDVHVVLTEQHVDLEVWHEVKVVGGVEARRPTNGVPRILVVGRGVQVVELRRQGAVLGREVRRHLLEDLLPVPGDLEALRALLARRVSVIQLVDRAALEGHDQDLAVDQRAADCDAHHRGLVGKAPRVPHAAVHV
mmetsp:Transcript_80001/g.205836  ORF Transcript_80001/g.205836 Transcript_80001/m.205836 type:complete len:208 (-) Transcript_80001:587-1210(-)